MKPIEFSFPATKHVVTDFFLEELSLEKLDNTVEQEVTKLVNGFNTFFELPNPKKRFTAIYQSYMSYSCRFELLKTKPVLTVQERETERLFGDYQILIKIYSTKLYLTSVQVTIDSISEAGAVEILGNLNDSSFFLNEEIMNVDEKIQKLYDDSELEHSLQTVIKLVENKFRIGGKRLMN
jgi:hypothetical protein